MLLNDNISLIEFLRTVSRCSGDVYFLTNDGDRLNLKSELAKYLFLSLAASDESSILNFGEIYCREKDDYRKLEVFLTE